MKFEEEFPSLKDFYMDYTDIVKNVAEHCLVDEAIKRVQTRVSEEVKKHCIDKQRVKEEIDELIFRFDPSHFGDISAEEFNKELCQLKENLGV